MKRFRNVSAIVTLLAGFITAVVMIINRYSLVSFLWILIGVMVCFYAVSRIICFIVDRKITKAGIDLKNLGAGTHNVTVALSLPDGITVVGNVTVNVTITAIQQETTTESTKATESTTSATR